MTARFTYCITSRVSQHAWLVLLFVANVANAQSTTKADRIDEISKSFSSSPSNVDASTLTWVLAIGAILLIAGAVFFLAYQFQDSKTVRSGNELRGASRELGLNLLQSLLLRWVSRKVGIDNMLGLLLSRGTFDHWTNVYLESLSSRRKRVLAPQFVRIRKTVFTDR